MANTLYTPEQLARVAIGLVDQDLVIASTVNRDYEAEFAGGVGLTVNARVPAFLTGRKRTAGAVAAITVDDVTESNVAVTLTDQAYSAVRLTDADLTLSLEDFGRQVLAPQVGAVVRTCEDTVIDVMQALTASLTVTWSGADPIPTFTAARKALRDLKVPATDLYCALGTELAADLLNSDKLTDASKAGGTGALRDATIGKIRGFTVIESNALAEDEAIFYHRNAFTLAVRAPQVAAGATFGQSIAADGFALTAIRDYDPSILADRSVVSAFIGAQVLGLKNAGGVFTPAIRVVKAP
jgi:hypothetical protein